MPSNTGPSDHASNRECPTTATTSPRPQADSRLQGRTRELLNLLVNGPDEIQSAVFEHLQHSDAGTVRDLVGELARQQREAREALGRADQALAEHQELLRELSRPPLLEAGVVAVNEDGTYVVAIGAYNRQEVVAHPEMKDAELQVGDVVGLSQDHHVIVKQLRAGSQGPGGARSRAGFTTSFWSSFRASRRLQ